MTQKEAIIKALEEHGGRERLLVIYPRVIQLATFKPDSDKYNKRTVPLLHNITMTGQNATYNENNNK